MSKQKTEPRQHRLGEAIQDYLPDLSREEKDSITKKMAHNALATVDFHVLIILSSSIAFFGLMLNSGAVVIGAMLVAPLMSPMMAIGFSIVTGKLKQLTTAVASTLIGIALAIAISSIFAFILPVGDPTGEVLSRTKPTLLDMLVALVSGLAGAYALNRSEVSSSLTGVAISAALVPPLCVVGYGIGTWQLQLAGGAMLLFLTNLASIVFSSSIIFMLFGFHPPRSDSNQYVRRGLIITIVGLLAVAIPLTVTTYTQIVQANDQKAVEAYLTDLSDADIADFEDIVIEPSGGGYIINLTLYSFSDDFGSHTDIERLRGEVSSIIDKPTSLRVRLIPAELGDVRDSKLPFEDTLHQ